MALSPTPRFIGLSLAIVLAIAGLELFLCTEYLRDQHLRQVAGILGKLNNEKNPEFSTVLEDVQVIAPGTVVNLFDAQGRSPIGEVVGALPQSRTDWALNCTAESRTPCIQGDTVAASVPTHSGLTGTSGRALAIVTIPRSWPASLFFSIFGIAMFTAAFVGWVFHWIVDNAFRKPLAALDLGALTAVSGGGGPAAENAILRPDGQVRESVDRLMNAVGDQIREVESIRADLSSREKMHLEWVAYLSHDLATPLARMLRRVETIQYDNEMKASDKEAELEQIHRDITELAEIVGSLSRFAVLESGIERDVVCLPLKPLLEDIVDDFEFEATNRGTELDLRVGDDIDSVRMERSLIKRAIENLVCNAIRYTPEGGLISVSATRDDGTVEIVVEDTGSGLPVQELERVFNFAFRGECSTRISKVGALGLGLALVRKVAEMHSGSVTARNVEPHGTRFVLSLPLVD
jgi:signal transduction histidine kinase